MHDPTPNPSPPLKAMAFVARSALALMLYAWFLVAVGWGALHLLIVPRIGDLRPQLEATISRGLGLAVRIEAIAAYSTGVLPAFELSNVTLFDEQGREALRLPRVLVSLSPKSILKMRFDQLYVDRPTLNVRRAVDGKIFVAGIDFSTRRGADDGLLGELFAQPEFVIRHGTVLWTDELRAVPALALRDVDLVLRNIARRHELRLDATPPADWGDRFGVTAKFEQPFLSMESAHWQQWSGQVFASFARVDLSQLKRHANLGIDLQQGRGAVRAWVDVRRATVSAVTADVVLADVAISLDPALQSLLLASMSGRLAGTFSGAGFEFSTYGLEFDTADGLRWPGGNLRLTRTDGATARPAQWDLVADRLDLAALTQIAGGLPLGGQVHRALTAYAPTGLIESFAAKWQGPIDAIGKYELKARVKHLHVRARPAAIVNGQALPAEPASPGIQGASLDIELTESAGKATLALQNGSVELPGVLEDPVVPFAQLSTNLAWQIDRGTIQLQVSNLRFSNPDAEGEFHIKWRTSDPHRSGGRARFPGVLDLQGRLTRAEAARVFRYLPLVLDQDVRHYVRDAVLGGAGSDVRFSVKGDLFDMPFANPNQGQFLISANIRNGVFAYVPRGSQPDNVLPWPALTQLSGHVVFERKGLLAKVVSGSLAGKPGLQITKGEAVIADLLQSPGLVVGFDARGPLSDMHAAVNGTPLGELTGIGLTRATATGNAELRLKMNFPLDAPERSSVQGSMTLLGNDIQFSAQLPRLAFVHGVVGFTETGFSVNAIQATVFGGEVRLNGGTVPASATGLAGTRAAAAMSFRAEGVASVDGLRQAQELGLVSRLARHASGSAAYVASVVLRSGVAEVSISSNLAGLALNLPAPLNKTAETTMPVRFESALLRESMAPASDGRIRLRDQLVLDLGRIGSVSYQRDLSGDEPRVIRGAIGIGLLADESAPLPGQGVAANIRLDRLDLDAWGRILEQVGGTNLAEYASAGVRSAGGITPAAHSYLPNRVALRAREIAAGGRKLRNVVIGGSRDGAIWRSNLDADELNGYVEYRQASESGGGRVFARLSRLTLAPASATDVETLLDVQPAAIPALDIVVDELELRGKKLGRVEVEAVNRAVATGAGGVREWRLNRFDIVNPEASFRATGNWAATNAQGVAAAPVVPSGAHTEPRRTVMSFKLDIDNAGDLLNRLGMKDAIRRGNGTMQGQVAWAGSPLALDYASLAGAFSINLENGQFLKTDPGLAKLLGVLSLQSLPRRLALDFRDVFTDGFAFDFIRGDVKIDHGIARANNLQMKGVNAAVLMDGQADLFRETQDIKVVVVPEINAGTVSLIATAINPAIGLGSFLAQYFLRVPLMEAATQEFHVDGSWLDPRVRKVDRKTGVASPLEQAPDSDAAKSIGERR